MNRQEAVLEALVDFIAELSVIGVRGDDGDCVFYEPSANAHVNGILDVSSAPAPLPPGVAGEAIEIARGILEALDVTGVLCVEFFLTRDHRLLVNELAPRPHNSGHLTIDACVTSQFEQQLRAVCGLPLGNTQMLRLTQPWRTLLGEIWSGGEPDWPGRARRARYQAPSLWQTGTAPWPQDGTSQCHRGNCRRSRTTRQNCPRCSRRRWWPSPSNSITRRSTACHIGRPIMAEQGHGSYLSRCTAIACSLWMKKASLRRS